MNNANIFIGRQTELRAFSKSLYHIIGEKPSFFSKIFAPFLNKKAEIIPEPKVFLFYGEGGFGKSALTYECQQKATELGFLTIPLDWDDYYARRNTLPNTSAKMITALFTVLTEEQHQIANYFDEYLRVEGKLESIAKTVERVWQDDASTLINAATTAGSAALATQGIPVPNVVRTAVNKTANAAYKETRRAMIERIRESRKMKREELDLYENNEKALTDALIDGLATASQRHPILLAIDTYEQVDSGADVDDWMRNVFLKQLLVKAPKVIVILAGRNNHFNEYRNKLPNEFLFHRNFDDILFSDQEIRELASLRAVEFSEEEILRIRASTAGIPLVVKDVINLLLDGHDRQQVLRDLDQHKGTVQEIISGMVNRFLKYTEHGDWRIDRDRCIQIVMLRDFDPDILQKAWKVETADFRDLMQTLAVRHSFINLHTHRIHDKVREFLQKHLINQYRQNTADTPHLRTLATELLQAVNLQLDRLREELTTSEDRYADNRYIAALQNYLFCNIWADSGKILPELPSLLVEMLVFSPQTLKEFALRLEDIAPIFSTGQLRTVKVIYEGLHAYESLTIKNSEKPPFAPENQLFTYLMKEKEQGNQQHEDFFQFLYGCHLVRHGEYERAFELLELALQTLGERLEQLLNEAYFRIGYLLQEKNIDKEKALICYSRAIELNFNYVDAYNNRGILFKNLNQNEKALEDYNKAIEINPNYANAYYNRAILFQKLNQNEEALEDYNKAIAINPNYAEAYDNRAILFEKLNQNEKALEDYNKAIEINPNYANAYNNRAILFEKLNQNEKALENYNKAIEINPNYVDAYNNRANLFKKLNQNEKALEDYNKAIEINPNYANAYNNRAILFQNLNQNEKALENYNKAIEINPNFAAAYYNRAILFKKLNQNEKALEDYNKAIEINPNYSGAYCNRANLFAKLNQYEKALQDCDKIIEISNDASAWHNKGWIYLCQHNFIEAEKYFLTSWTLFNNKNNQNAMNLGHLHLLQNHRPQAIEWYQKSLPLWEDVAVFFQGMEADYQDVKMAEAGIDIATYQALIAELKDWWEQQTASE